MKPGKAPKISSERRRQLETARKQPGEPVDPAVMAMVHSLPPKWGWTEGHRERYLRAWTAVLDYVYRVRTIEELDAAQRIEEATEAKRLEEEKEANRKRLELREEAMRKNEEEDAMALEELRRKRLESICRGWRKTEGVCQTDVDPDEKLCRPCKDQMNSDVYQERKKD